MVKKVLLVDDMEDLSALIKQLIESIGFSVDAFINPLEALDHLQNPNEYAVVVCDYHMPEMNGVEFIKKLKQKNQDCDCLLFTSFGSSIPKSDLEGVSKVFDRFETDKLLGYLEENYL